MLSPSFSISPKDLWHAIATHDAPQLVDVRRRDAYEQSPQLLPGASGAMPARRKRGRPISTAPGLSSLPARPAMK